MTTHLFPNPLPKRPSGAPDAGGNHRSIPRGAGSVRASVLASASRSTGRCLAVPQPLQPGIVLSSGSDAPLDSLLRRNPVPAVPIAPLGCVTPSGGPTRVQHDIQPGAISTGVTATVALRLDADRPDRVEAMRQGRRCFLQTGRIGMSGRWLWVGGMDAADLADHNQRPDGPPREIRDEYESLHGPTSIERHARKKHRRDATPTDAA